jgi:hypothetical protein
VLEPDSTRVVPSHAGAPGGGLDSPHALQILTTEHWSLLAARSLGYTESMSRASMFIAALSGSVIALALVGQATEFGDGFVAFALVLLPVVYFLGISTLARLSQNNYEDAVWVQGMNRIRSAYLELAPTLQPYFVTSRHDDTDGVLLSSLAMRRPLPKLQPFFSIPGVIAVIDSVVAGGIAGIAALGLDLRTGLSVALGGLAFAVSLAAFVLWAQHEIARHTARLVVRFPEPEADEPTG